VAPRAHSDYIVRCPLVTAATADKKCSAAIAAGMSRRGAAADDTMNSLSHTTSTEGRCSFSMHQHLSTWLQQLLM